VLGRTVFQKCAPSGGQRDRSGPASDGGRDGWLVGFSLPPSVLLYAGCRTSVVPQGARHQSLTVRANLRCTACAETEGVASWWGCVVRSSMGFCRGDEAAVGDEHRIRSQAGEPQV